MSTRSTARSSWTCATWGGRRWVRSAAAGATVASLTPGSSLCTGSTQSAAGRRSDWAGGAPTSCSCAPAQDGGQGGEWSGLMILCGTTRGKTSQPVSRARTLHACERKSEDPPWSQGRHHVSRRVSRQASVHGLSRQSAKRSGHGRARAQRRCSSSSGLDGGRRAAIPLGASTVSLSLCHVARGIFGPLVPNNNPRSISLIHNI